jgi:hypothetical protein
MPNKVTLDQLMKEFALVDELKRVAATGRTFDEMRIIFIQANGWTWGIIEQAEKIGGFMFER